MAAALDGVRPLTADDLADVLAIEDVSYPRPWSEVTWRGEFDRGDRVLLGHADEVDRLDGYAGALLVTDEAEVTTVAVAPAARGRGIAHALVAALLDELLRRGALAVTLEVRESDAAAQRVYTGAGFVREGRRPGYYSDNGEAALVMWIRDLATNRATNRATDARPGA